MAEKLLLHMEYELIRHRVNVPWDNIAHRLSKRRACTLPCFWGRFIVSRHLSTRRQKQMV